MLTLMAVHAHPDDEVMGTGGSFAKYAAEGVRTVLVTCTNGEQGDGPGGVKPGEPGHSETQVAEQRIAELAESVGHLNITHLELLGYHDSGMAGWAGNASSDAFANVDFDKAVARVAALMEEYRPQVVVTYDENGNYGHPDHIQAHRVAVAAAEATGIPVKFYYTAVPRRVIQAAYAAMKAQGMDPGWELPEDFGTPDELITTVVDTHEQADVKLAALRAHGSQGDSISLLSMPPETQRMAMSAEHFVRVFSRVPAPDHEDDLFAGLR
ncbi:PIG-L family deacetylase [Herbidospora sp. NBRC 101105]|uniref:PIG-L family deacetylase n=1 Tax=Herbidospora sp. NBRC 101105 TaxID=3032195 RepID=UPI0024A5BFBE|nr:PIG-L family deacetylase [Herbidospora sp. NBRC 101105]GLX96019.1 GlcNAc-PI de-N-acetylase [Herbidospora sp. NBRC 101105]